MIRFTYTPLLSIILLIVISLLFQKCREDYELFFDCNDKLDINKFYFIGSFNTENVSHINNNNQSNSLYASASISFNEDSTFILSINIPCYSPSIGPVFCDSTDRGIDRKSIEIRGSWDFKQSIEYKTHTSGYPYNNTYRTRSFHGVCSFNITNSPLSAHLGKIIHNDFSVHCSGINSIDAIRKSLEFYLPISENEGLFFSFSGVES